MIQFNRNVELTDIHMSLVLHILGMAQVRYGWMILNAPVMSWACPFVNFLVGVKIIVATVKTLVLIAVSFFVNN